MKYGMNVLLTLFTVIGFSKDMSAQNDTTKDNQSLFNDLMYRQGSAYRSAAGKPCPEYW